MRAAKGPVWAQPVAKQAGSGGVPLPYRLSSWALTVAVAALHPTLQIGLHPVGGSNGGVQHVSLAGGEAERASLHEAAPLGRMLARVGAGKASILAAIEALEAEPTVGGGRQRALGDTLRAVLRWIALDAPAAAAEDAAGCGLQRQSSKESDGKEAAQGRAGALASAQGFPGMRLLLFLSGPPNVGAGAVVARRPSSAELAAAQRAAAEQAEQAARELAALALDPQAGPRSPACCARAALTPVAPAEQPKLPSIQQRRRAPTADLHGVPRFQPAVTAIK